MKLGDLGLSEERCADKCGVTYSSGAGRGSAGKNAAKKSGEIFLRLWALIIGA